MTDMLPNYITHAFRWPSILVAGALLLVGISLSGCDILEVNNPNNLVEEDLNNPASATAMVNGLEATVTRALGAIHAPYATASDELTWVGSRDAWQQLDFGNIDDPNNEFTDAAFPYVGEARWMADDVIGRLEAFRAEGTLSNPGNLARAYLYGAIIYTSIADIFEDFAFSDRREGQPPVGPENMAGLYDTALDYIDKGLALDAGLEAALRGMKARVLYSKALWQKLNPAGSVDTANPLVNNAEAVTAAQEALAAMTSDFIYQLELDPASPDLVVGDLSMALQVNDRLEMRIADTYIQPTEDDKKVESVTFQDLIDGVVHPYLESVINAFVAADEYADITIVSAREMHLILAEAALASGGDFTTPINDLRALDGLSDYTGQVNAQDLLINSRQANLFLQGRRLADHYRFQDGSPEWTTDAAPDPGTFFPITITEIEANPNIN